MNATYVKISLDTRRTKKDGTYPVILRLTHNRKTTSIKTGISIKEQDWDEASGQVKNSYKGTASVKRLNNELQKKKADALDNVLRMSDKVGDAHSSIDIIRQKINPTSIIASFYQYTDKLIKQLVSSERIDTARSYGSAITALKTFNKGKSLEKNKRGNPLNSKSDSHFNKVKTSGDLHFSEINYSFLNKFENYHLANGNELNGLAVYMHNTCNF